MNKSQIEKATEWIKAYVAEHGGITASEIVDQAAEADHPLHDLFEWDDTAAAHAYRLIQGRKLIRQVSVRMEDPLVHVPKQIDVQAQTGTREGTYKPVSIVRQHPDEFERAYAEALKRLASAAAAVEQLEARTKGESEKIAIIGLATKSLETATEALRQLH